MQAAQTNPTPNFGILILLVLCFWGAGKDRAYKKGGGIKPDRFEKILLLATTAGCILVLFLIGLRSPEAAGTLTPLVAVAVFGSWEIHRLQIRRKNPVAGMLK